MNSMLQVKSVFLAEANRAFSKVQVWLRSHYLIDLYFHMHTATLTYWYVTSIPLSIREFQARVSLKAVK